MTASSRGLQGPSIPITEPTLRRTAWALWAISVSIPLIGLILRLLAVITRHLTPSSRSEVIAGLTFTALEIGIPTLGAVVVSRQPKNPIGWIFLAVGLELGLVGLADAYVTHASGSLPGAPVAAWIASLGEGPWGFGIFALVFLLFPDGHLESSRWRPVARATATAMVLLALSDALLPGPLRSYPRIRNPFGVGALSSILSATDKFSFVILLLTLLAAAASLVLRFRGSRGDERQQLKWVASATVLAAVLVLSGPIFWFVLPSSLAWLWNAVLILAVASVPVSMGIAMLKYRLYDIDLIINRALVYGSLTVGVVGLYVLVVGYLANVLQSDNNLGISLLATGIVAVIFQPLRERLQRVVNHLMFGERDDPYAVISRLGQRLEATLSPESVLPTVVETVAQALKLPYAAVALKRPGGYSVVAATGRPVDEPVSLPLTYQQENVGLLFLGPRGPGESFGSADRKLLDDLARQAGFAVHAVRLTVDLQRSREKLVTAREEERLRLRRDLHDSLGPAIAAQTLKAGSARALYASDPDTADGILAELERDMKGTLAEVRRLIYDLRPPALDELGLVGAIEEQVQQYSAHPSLALSVEAPASLPPLPAAVEAAAYRIAQEALANVLHHADASNCCVRLQVREWVLDLEIADDGRGLDTERRAGVGLNSMRERAEELRGTLTVESGPGRGTRVAAHLPLARPSQDLSDSTKASDHASRVGFRE